MQNNDYIDTLHPENNPDANIFPRIVNNCIPDGAITYIKLNADITALFDSINQSIQTLTDDYDALELIVSGHTTDITTIQSTISSIQSTITSIQSDISTINSSLSSLSGTVTSLQSDVSTINSTLTSIQSTISSIQSDITSLNTTVTSLSGTVTSLQSDVSTLQSKVGILEDNVTAMQTAITSLQSRVNTLFNETSYLLDHCAGIVTIASGTSGTFTESEMVELSKAIPIIKFGSFVDILYKELEDGSSMYFTKYTITNNIITKRAILVSKSTRNWSLTYNTYTFNDQLTPSSVNDGNINKFIGFDANGNIIKSATDVITHDLKARYHLGAFDTESVVDDKTTVGRNTLYLDLSKLNFEYDTTNDIWTCNVQNLSGFMNDCDSTSSNYTTTHKAYNDLQNGELTTSKYQFSSNNHIIIKDNQNNYPCGMLECVIDSSLQYTEQVITNQPINTLDQIGSMWLRDEWKKGLNKFNINGHWFTEQVTVTISGNSVTLVGNYYGVRKINVIPNTTYYLKLDIVNATATSLIQVLTMDASSTIVSFSNGSASFNSGNNTELAIYFYCGQGAGGTSTYSNIMLNVGDHPYPFQEWNGEILHQKDIDISSIPDGTIAYTIGYDANGNLVKQAVSSTRSIEVKNVDEEIKVEDEPIIEEKTKVEETKVEEKDIEK